MRDRVVQLVAGVYANKEFEKEFRVELNSLNICMAIAALRREFINRRSASSSAEYILSCEGEDGEYHLFTEKRNYIDDKRTLDEFLHIIHPIVTDIEMFFGMREPLDPPSTLSDYPFNECAPWMMEILRDGPYIRQGYLW